MRIVFAGTPEAAVPSLERLAGSAHEVVAVVTRPDAPRGRRRVLTPSAVAVAADRLGLPVIRAGRLDADVTERIAGLQPELGAIVAYGGMVRAPLLSVPTHGWINLHFSLLPRWRGAAPVQRALMAGDRVTGASVFRLVEQLDAGDVFDELRYDVPPLATAGDVLDALAHRGGYLLEGVVDAISAGTAVARAQVGPVTTAEKLTLADGALDWTASADAVLARFRGVTPEPGAHTTIAGGVLKILRARPAESGTTLAPGAIAVSGREVLVGTGTEPIALDRVQPAGRAAMDAADWWRGLRDAPVAGS